MAVPERENICRSAEYFKNIFKYIYLVGWPNFWHAEHDVPAIFKQYHGSVSTFMIACTWTLVMLELAGFFTQTEFSEKQKTDRQLLGFSHPVLGSYGCFLTYFQKNVRAFTYSLTMELKEQYNDKEIEMKMIKKARRHSIAYCIFCSSALVSYGLDGLIQCLFDNEGTFVTVITAWPGLTDHSIPAVCFRILAYILWWIFMTRASAIYVLVISTFVCLGYQYKNLQSYFYNLNNIFDDDFLTQKEKEEKYIKGLKLGINMHARTLWCKLFSEALSGRRCQSEFIRGICVGERRDPRGLGLNWATHRILAATEFWCTRQCELSFKGVISGQILVNVGVILLLLVQMLNSERTLGSLAAILSTMTAMLISTGCFMWNAGDVTVEAEALSTAMFYSGWQNCVGEASVQVRKLVVIAMRQAQVPVSIRALGIIKMSYESYLSIVKSSYSVFSVLY